MISQYPYYEFEPGIFEIDEFDCASIFLIVGSKRAFLLDTGIGIGDLKTCVERLTDKQYDIVMSHGHGDHTGGTWAFDSIYMNSRDIGVYAMPPEMEMRKHYAASIAKREHKHYSYIMGNDFGEFESVPNILPLEDGQVFDLGDRTITAYDCPGHTPGEMVFIDSKSKILFAGDAVNCNLLIANKEGPQYVGIEKARDALRRIAGMAGTYYDPQKVYNSHHDYRGFGQPLAEDVLPDALQCLEELCAGTATTTEIPDPLGNGASHIVAVKGSVNVSF